MKLCVEEIAKMIDGTLLLNDASLKDEVSGVCIDSRKIETNNLYVPLLGERVDGHTFIKDVEAKHAALVLCSDDEFIPQHVATIKVKDTLVALQQLAHAYRKSLNCTVIGITGSNGKTSCKDILAGALSAKYKTQKTQGNKNNEIGVPLTLLSLDKDVEMAIIEMGMENREEIHFLSQIVEQDMAIITNVGIAHLENLGSLENIGKAKLEIIDSLPENSFFTYYGDDPILSKLMNEKKIPTHIETHTFGEAITNNMYITSFHQDNKGIHFQTNASSFTYHIDILGKHQAHNAMAAILIAKHLHMSDEDVQKGFATIQKTSMRNELMKVQACTILNDAYKSNPQSAKAALETFHGFKHPYKIVVLADMLDLGETSANLHYDLGYDLQKYQLQEIICVGKQAKHIMEGAKASCDNVVIHHFNNNEEVSAYLKAYIHKDCMILFKGSRGMALDEVIDVLIQNGEEYE